MDELNSFKKSMGVQINRLLSGEIGKNVFGLEAFYLYKGYYPNKQEAKAMGIGHAEYYRAMKKINLIHDAK